MDNNIQKFQEFLSKKFPCLDDIKHSFKFCSKYGEGKYLVSSEDKTINFDKLTEWAVAPKPQSADSLSFSDKYLFLIEFKSGDPTSHERKIEKLIENVKGKIDDSDSTLTTMYQEAFCKETERLKQRFCLVVDSKQMGITSLATVLTGLSRLNNDQMSPREKTLFERIYPDLKSGIKEPEHYDKLEIWYSELFDRYLSIYSIKNFN